MLDPEEIPELTIDVFARFRFRVYVLAIRSISFHSASLTGMTDSRGNRVSGKLVNAFDALISASVTGLFSA